MNLTDSDRVMICALVVLFGALMLLPAQLVEQSFNTLNVVLRHSYFFGGLPDLFSISVHTPPMLLFVRPGKRQKGLHPNPKC